MGVAGEAEGLNVLKCNLTEFFSDLEGRLALLTGKVSYEEFGLSLEDIRKPMLVVGLPGIGKTAGIISIIKKYNEVLPPEKRLGFKKILLGQTVVGSMQGIPVNVNGKVVRVQMPDLPSVADDGEYGVLFLDEITTADEMQIQPALGLCDDSRNLGTYTLPGHWLVVAAGNGPECANFVKMDDMTLSRFACYDIAYDYKTDWRPYAHKTGINEDIIAFLNFKPDACVRVESNDMHIAGKMFPCPRTWERLSKDLAMRAALQREVSFAQMPNFSSRIIGSVAASEFSAFLAFKTRLNYSPDKILAGKEKKPGNMQPEEFHILLEACLKKLKVAVETTRDSDGNHPLETYMLLVNFMNWILDMMSFEFQVNTIVEMKQINDIKMILVDDDFVDLCPRFGEFFEAHGDVLIDSMDRVESYF